MDFQDLIDRTFKIEHLDGVISFFQGDKAAGKLGTVRAVAVNYQFRTDEQAAAVQN